MTTILITGMSATGKSTLVGDLAARGYNAVDLDQPGWSSYQDDGEGGKDWMWVEDRVGALLAGNTDDVLIVSGCAANMARFYPQFDHIVLLTAPVPLMLERLATRSTNNFGKDPAERDKVLRDTEEIEPLLRRRANLVIDTSMPRDAVVDTVLGLLPEGSRGKGRP